MSAALDCLAYSRALYNLHKNEHMNMKLDIMRNQNHIYLVLQCKNTSKCSRLLWLV